MYSILLIFIISFFVSISSYADIVGKYTLTKAETSDCPKNFLTISKIGQSIVFSDSGGEYLRLQEKDATMTSTSIYNRQKSGEFKFNVTFVVTQTTAMLLVVTDALSFKCHFAVGEK